MPNSSTARETRCQLSQTLECSSCRRLQLALYTSNYTLLAHKLTILACLASGNIFHLCKIKAVAVKASLTHDTSSLFVSAVCDCVGHVFHTIKGALFKDYGVSSVSSKCCCPPQQVSAFKEFSSTNSRSAIPCAVPVEVYYCGDLNIFYRASTKTLPNSRIICVT